MTIDDRTGLTGVQYTAPLREDMLRALSQSLPPDTRNGLAQQRLAVVGKTIDDLFGAVTIVNPGAPTLWPPSTVRCRWRCIMASPCQSGSGYRSMLRPG